MFSKIPQNILNRFHLPTTKNLAENRNDQPRFRSLRNKIPIQYRLGLVRKITIREQILVKIENFMPENA